MMVMLGRRVDSVDREMLFDEGLHELLENLSIWEKRFMSDGHVY